MTAVCGEIRNAGHNKIGIALAKTMLGSERENFLYRHIPSTNLVTVLSFVITIIAAFIVCLFVFHLRPMDLNELGYQSHPLLQRCHPACGHEGPFHLSPVCALRFFNQNDAS